MIVVILTDCPPKLRGDLSKWLFEINTGVYVGRVNARIREALWNRICENLKHGQATMVYPSQCEQKMEFRVHNTSWEIADFDGLKLMRRPSPAAAGENRNAEHVELSDGFSRAASLQKARRIQASRRSAAEADSYIVIDIETTGLSVQSDEIVEIAAVKVENGAPAGEMSELVRVTAPFSEKAAILTGITAEMLLENGIPIKEALNKFMEFIGSAVLVCHNAQFDIPFIHAACRKNGIQPPRNKCIDTLAIAKRKVRGVPDYRLGTLAEHFGVASEGAHRALQDCRTAYGVYLKLKKI